MSESVAGDVFFHFPPVPTAEPGGTQRLRLGPPRNRPLSDEDVSWWQISKLVDYVLDGTTDVAALFGTCRTPEQKESRLRVLRLRLHPDKAGDAPRNKEAFQKVNEIFKQ